MTATHLLAALGHPPRRIVVVGAGNIGSQFVPHVAHLPGIDEVLIVDPDVYETRNLSHQAIGPHDVGHSKADVQGKLLRRLAPRLKVTSFRGPVQDLPWGKLAASIVVSCVDSRAARLHLNEVAWRVGSLLIDTAVGAAGRLARCNVYQPAGDAPCLECAWGDDDYAAIPQVHVCAPRVHQASTAAPTSLGGVAAAYAASECEKALCGGAAHLAIGRQVLLDLQHHQQYVTRLARHPGCRFDHQTWNIVPLAVALTKRSLRGFRDDLQRRLGVGVRAWCVAARAFHGVRSCLTCGRMVDGPVGVIGRDGAGRGLCRVCGGMLVDHGFRNLAWLAWDDVPRRELRRTLRAIGARAEDVVVVQADEGRYYVRLVDVSSVRSTTSVAASAAP